MWGLGWSLWGLRTPWMGLLWHHHPHSWNHAWPHCWCHGRASHLGCHVRGSGHGGPVHARVHHDSIGRALVGQGQVEQDLPHTRHYGAPTPTQSPRIRQIVQNLLGSNHNWIVYVDLVFLGNGCLILFYVIYNRNNYRQGFDSRRGGWHICSG